ncbi:MAG: hypothetical protein KGL35_29035 [Bradyrhizobium sp.]|nr:hypothetical protein [Bradyrhizobium sp.]
MTKKNDEIGPRLEKLALQVLDDAEHTSEAAERLDGFRAVSSYYVTMIKVRAKVPDDESVSDRGDFNAIRDRLKAVS